MKHSKQAQQFLKQRKGDKQVRELIAKGGNKGSKSLFDKILQKASKPLKFGQ